MSRMRQRAMWWSLLGILTLSVLLPTTAYFFPNLIPSATAEEVTNPRSDYWRQVRSGEPENGYTAVGEHQAGAALIQSSGQNWRQLRNGPLATYGGIGLLVALGLILLFYLIRGQVKLEEPRSGVKIQRWHVLERMTHWTVAVTFIILAITGLSLLFGRAVLIPVLGKEAFAAYAQFARDAHNFIAPFFAAVLLIMLLIWLKNNFFNQVDVKWFAKGGGIFTKGHPSAGFMNGGEKMWYWVVFMCGLVVTISGFVLYLPVFGQERGGMQLAHLFHAGFAILWIAFTFGHIYIGTLGTEGALEGMTTGNVDAAWAKQHHDLWYEEVKDSQQVEDAPPKVGGEAVSSGMT